MSRATKSATKPTTEKIQQPSLVGLFDELIEDAPLDFQGTGESSRWARQWEKEWRLKAKQLREALAVLEGLT